MGWMDEYAGSWDDGFGTFLDRTCYWKVSHTFEQGSSQIHLFQGSDSQIRSRYVVRIGSMLGTPFPLCDRSLYTAIG